MPGRCAATPARCVAPPARCAAPPVPRPFVAPLSTGFFLTARILLRHARSLRRPARSLCRPARSLRRPACSMRRPARSPPHDIVMHFLTRQPLETPLQNRHDYDLSSKTGILRQCCSEQLRGNSSSMTPMVNRGRDDEPMKDAVLDPFTSISPFEGTISLHLDTTLVVPDVRHPRYRPRGACALPVVYQPPRHIGCDLSGGQRAPRAPRLRSLIITAQPADGEGILAIAAGVDAGPNARQALWHGGSRIYSVARITAGPKRVEGRGS
ncbi:hypothetical protein B0H11DRAFT_2307525 [Mycena galericulata]|nr:hypothetical protein B0H11DRAFT_2307525 [Mycena galericulata]